MSTQCKAEGGTDNSLERKGLGVRGGRGLEREKVGKSYHGFLFSQH